MLGTQEVYTDEKGWLRFKENRIVSMLVDNFKFDDLTGLNAVAMWSNLNNISDDEYAQLAQLIGYSVYGWGTLSSVSDEYYDKVVSRLDKV